MLWRLEILWGFLAIFVQPDFYVPWEHNLPWRASLIRTFSRKKSCQKQENYFLVFVQVFKNEIEVNET